MNKKDFTNFGSDLKGAIKKSIDSQDYAKMGREVGGIVNSALETAFEEMRNAISSVQAKNQSFNSKSSTTQKQHTKKQQVKKSKANSVYFPHSPVGKIVSILLTIFGGIGIGVFGIVAVIFWILGISTSMTIGFSIFFGMSVLMEMKGSKIRKRLKRYKRYLSLFLERKTCTVEELSVYSGFTQKFIRKDIKKMIDIGMFPEGHIDRHKTLIMLNHESYNQHLAQQEELEASRIKERQRNEETNKGKGVKNNRDFKVDITIEEGKNYIQQINKVKSDIRDGLVTNKVHWMEEIIRKIIDYVEYHPEQLSEVRKFMQYYLPTTIRLLNSYREFEGQPIQGENITMAKNEIKNALDTINQAFGNLLDSLFQSASMDVSTDISVLHTMLAQEGLTKQDFNTSKDKGGTK